MEGGRDEKKRRRGRKASFGGKKGRGEVGRD